ncbi:hypothetical protein D3C75_934380 [compost metagenome]
MQLLQNFTLIFRKIGFHAVEEQGGLIQKPFRRADILDDNGFGVFAQFCFLFTVQIFACINNDRQIIQFFIVTDLIQQLKAGHIIQHKIKHHAVISLLAQLTQCLLSGGYCRDGDIIMADKLHDGPALNFIILHDQQMLQSAGCVILNL